MAHSILRQLPAFLRLAFITAIGILLGNHFLFRAFAQPANPHESAGSNVTDVVDTDPAAAAANEAELLSGTRQLTFEGRRAGEGYFSQDGSQLVFQSERETGNPFFQIYVMDRQSGDIQRVSPGHGKTTCAWIHPDGNKVLFASTHEDESARDKQRAEIELRQSGNERRYSWDYDEHFEIYEFDRTAQTYRKLTDARGYDAEGSWSPDGRLIAFSSNRLAYDGEMTAKAERAIRARSGNHERHLHYGCRRQECATAHNSIRLRRRPVFFPGRQANLLAAVRAERRDCRSLDDEYRRF